MKITRDKEWYFKWHITAYWVGMVLCIVPTIFAGLLEFPVIATKEAESTLSGTFIIVLVAAALPLYKWVKTVLKSPSIALLLWIGSGILYLILSMPMQTVKGLFIVFLTAAIGNTIAIVFFKLSDIWKEKWRFCGEIKIKGGNG